MNYLDVGPLIAALRATPEEFEAENGWLNHVRSRHSFWFGANDRIEVRAECECALLAVRTEQERELAIATAHLSGRSTAPLVAPLASREMMSELPSSAVATTRLPNVSRPSRFYRAPDIAWGTGARTPLYALISAVNRSWSTGFIKC